MHVQIAVALAAVVGIASCISFCRTLVRNPVPAGGFGTGMIYVFPPVSLGALTGGSMFLVWHLAQTMIGPTVIVEFLLMVLAGAIIHFGGRTFILGDLQP